MYININMITTVAVHFEKMTGRNDNIAWTMEYEHRIS